MKTNLCPKNCDLDLTALAAGDLPAWRAIPLRRHLRACARCAATYDEIESLFSQAQNAPRISPAQAGDLQERMWSQIAAERPTRSPAARLPKRRVFALSMAGSAVAAGVVMATFLLPPGAPLAPTPSFAMVAKAMAEAQSVEFRMVDTTDYGKYKHHIVDDSRFALRLNPPTIVMVETRGESQSFTHSDEAASYTNVGSLWEGKPEFYVVPTRSVTALRKVIRNSMSFKSGQPGLGMAFQWGAAKRVRLDGRPALRFDGVGGSSWVRPDAHYHPWIATVWVDPTTLHFLRYESSQRMNDNFTQSAVASEYVYDRPDAHSVLTKAPPVGTPLALLGAGFTPATEAEAQQARAIVDVALSAWKAGSWNQFAACCDGGAPLWNQPIAPVAPASHQPLDAELPEATWKSIVETSTYQPHSAVKSVTKAAVYTLVRQSAQEPMPRDLPSNVLVARTSNVWFFLKPTSDAGLKIFHITYTGSGPVARTKAKEAVGEWP